MNHWREHESGKLNGEAPLPLLAIAAPPSLLHSTYMHEHPRERGLTTGHWHDLAECAMARPRHSWLLDVVQRAVVMA